MSVLGNPLLLGPEGYQISRSVRLRSSASAYFNRTPASAGNRQIYTWSGWVKRGTLGGTFPSLFWANNGSTSDVFQFNNADALRFFQNDGTSSFIATAAVFRDPSAWYHIVLAVDTTQATASNRVKIYVNGVSQNLSGSTYPTQNYSGYINNTFVHRIGNSDSFDGYLTDVNFIDGQALTPSSFGETDAVTGVWKPKKYAGTYGTNGFYLNFSDNSAATAATIGKDNSGNGNNWTPNNISVTAGATYDSMLDVPTLWADGGNGRGNYCVVSPIDKASNITVSNGNLTASYTGATDLNKYRGTIECPVGAWYWEVTVTTDPRGGIGIGSASSPLTAGGAQTYTYHESGKLFINNVDQGVLFGTYAAGDVIGVAVDVTGNTVRWYKNGVAQGSGTTSISSAYAYFATGSCYSAIHNYNFGQRPFAYTPPTGFKALNTQSLPEPTIKKGNQYFDATTYTGNGGTQSIVNSGAMQPDLVWVKSRSAATSNDLFDSVRGATLGLTSNATSAEGTWSGVTAFNSNGFTLGSNTSDNASGASYVGWQWKESVSAGFDIVTYTGTGVNRTVAHNLGVAPNLIIVKNRGATAAWAVRHSSLGANDYLLLNLTNAVGTSSTVFNGAPSSTVFNVGTDVTTNANTNTYVAYLFAEVAGFSKFGSYTGNGSADGPFVFCGFRPRFVMVKRTQGLGNWVIHDTSRSPSNATNLNLFTNLSNAETTEYPFDILSNGFKLRESNTDVNDNTGTMIYMAFAENPFKNSLAR